MPEHDTAQDSTHAAAAEVIPRQPGSVPFILLHHAKIQTCLSAALSLLFILALFRLRVLLNFASAFAGGAERDAGLYLWLMRSNCAGHFFRPWFSTNGFYPYGYSLAWSDNFILPSLLACPLIHSGLPPALVWNVIFMTAMLLNGYFTWLLIYRLVGSNSSALLGGASFMVCGALSSQLGHPQLQFAFFLPLAALLLLKFLAEPRLRTSVLIGLCLSLAFITTVYYAVFAATLMGILLLAALLLRPERLGLRSVLLFTGGCAAGLFPLAPFIMPYLAVRDTFGARHLYEPFYFAASGLSYLSSSPFNLLYHKSALWTHDEAHLFAGVVLLALSLLAFLRLSEGSGGLRRVSYVTLGAAALAGLLSSVNEPLPDAHYAAAACLWIFAALFVLIIYRMGRMERLLRCSFFTDRDLTALFLLGAAAFYIISLGPLANSAAGQPVFSPHRVIFELVPGWNAIRAVARAGIVVIFCLCVAASLALRRLQIKRGFGIKSCAAVLILALIEQYQPIYQLQPEPLSPIGWEISEKLAEGSDAVIVLPLTREIRPDGQVQSWGDFAELNVKYLKWLLPTGVPLVNGYSGQRSKIMLEYPRKMSDFPDDRSLTAISLIAGLRYVLYMPSLDPKYDSTAFQNAVAGVASSLDFVASDASGNMLFRYTGEQRLRESFFLLAPALPGTKVSFDLMAVYEEDAPLRVVKVFAQPHGVGPEDRRALAALNVKADGTWSSHSIVIPDTEDRVRPVVIRFSSPPGSIIYIRNSSINNHRFKLRGRDRATG